MGSFANGLMSPMFWKSLGQAGPLKKIGFALAV
jgi:hypothetical protein